MSRFFRVLLLLTVPLGRCGSSVRAASAEAPSLGLTRVLVKPNLYLVVGGGANSAFLVTGAGVVVVGAKESEAAGRDLEEVIAGVTSRPVRYLIEPNHQARYTHGSPAFPRSVAIAADIRARRHMLEPPERTYWTGPAASHLPALLVTDRKPFTLGGVPVEVIRPGRGSTDGDLIVRFPEQHAVHMGDLFWSHRLPFIDERHGGSATALISTLRRVLDLPGVETFIPGYGDVGTRADVEQQLKLLQDLQAQVRQSIARNRTRTQTIAAIPVPLSVRSAGSERFHALIGAFYDDLAPRRAPARARGPAPAR